MEGCDPLRRAKHGEWQACEMSPDDMGPVGGRTIATGSAKPGGGRDGDGQMRGNLSRAGWESEAGEEA